jgi:hypothetical protein
MKTTNYFSKSYKKYTLYFFLLNLISFGCSSQKDDLEIEVKLSLKDYVHVLLEDQRGQVDSVYFMFEQLILSSRSEIENSKKSAIYVIFEKFNQLYPNYSLSLLIKPLRFRDSISFNTKDEIVIKILQNDYINQTNKTFEILKKRFKGIGIKEVYYKKLNDVRYLIHLKKVTNIDEVNTLLSYKGDFRILMSNFNVKEENHQFTTSIIQNKNDFELINLLAYKDTISRKYTKLSVVRRQQIIDSLVNIVCTKIELNNGKFDSRVIGSAHARDKGTINAFLKNSRVNTYWSIDTIDNFNIVGEYRLFVINPNYGYSPVIKRAWATKSPFKQCHTISFKVPFFSAQKEFTQALKKLNDNPIIVLDNTVLSTPKFINKTQNSILFNSKLFTRRNFFDINPQIERNEVNALASIIKYGTVPLSLEFRFVNSKN